MTDQVAWTTRQLRGKKKCRIGAWTPSRVVRNTFGMSGDPNKSKWIYDVSEDMKHFELALFGRQGRWTKNACPLDYDARSIGVHSTAAVVFAPNKGFRAILEAIVTCNLVGNSPCYWKYMGNTTPYHWKDGGLCLTDAGRWRSDSCLWFVKRQGWEHVSPLSTTNCNAWWMPYQTISRKPQDRRPKQTGLKVPHSHAKDNPNSP